MAEGWTKDYRKTLKWEWFTAPNTAHFFQYCRLKANYTEGNFRGIKIPIGSFVSSLEKMSLETGLTISQIRTAIKNLKITGEVTHKTTSQYSIISIKNWNKYQGNDKQMTNERQTNDNNIRNKEGKEIKKPLGFISSFFENYKEGLNETN